MFITSEQINEFSSSISSSDVISYITEHQEEYEDFLKNYDTIFNDKTERNNNYDIRRIKKTKFMD